MGSILDSTLTAGDTLRIGDAMLAPLGSNGGPTETAPPLPDSPVVDAAGASTVSLDQRGFPRPIGSARDIGAVESLILQGFPENAQNDVTLLPVLDWGDVAGASFEVFFDSGAGLQSIGQTSESSLAVPSLLASDRSYSWRVDTTLGGLTAPGAVRSFTTRPPVRVTTEVDENDGFGVGNTSLREAIAEAIDGETILFDAGVNGKRCVLTNGQLLIDKDLTIDASGLDRGFIVDANGEVTGHRVVEIGVGSTVTMKTLGFTGGKPSGGGGGGGGILNRGTLTLENSSVSRNQTHSSGWGGGIYNKGGHLNTINCTLANNRSDYGGGLFTDGTDGTASLVQTTISANSARTGGGGLWRNGGSFSIENTIVAGNSAASANDMAGSPTRSGVNLIGGDPMLSALGYYGGPTESMHPLVNSPAIDPAGGANASGLSTDQRGFPRVADGGGVTTGVIVDIGAVEAGAVVLVTDRGDDAERVGTLRHRIANASVQGTVIRFGASFDGDADADIETASELTLAAGQAIFLDASDRPRGVTVAGTGASRLFRVNSGSVLAVHSLTLTGGNADDDTGGAIQSSGVVTLDGCTLSGNTATFGGGAVDSSGWLGATRSTFFGNSAPSGAGGAIQGGGSGWELRHCTIADNTGSDGGGIYTGVGQWDRSALACVVNCIVSGNVRHSDDSAEDIGNQGVLTRRGNNLIGVYRSYGPPAARGTSRGPEAISADKFLAPAGDYGGPTPTMPPLAGSPAIDAAATTGGLVTDQRGFPSPIGVAADLGAVEVGERLVDSVADAGEGSLREAIADSNFGEIIRFDAEVFDGSPEATIRLNSELVASGRVVSIDASPLPSGVTISGGGSSRVFDFSGGSAAVLDTLTITDGDAGGGSGGGVSATDSFLVVRNSTIHGNRAAAGAGLHSSGSSGVLEVVNSTIARNTAANYAGGVNSAGSAVSFTHVTVCENAAANNGTAGIVLIDGSGFFENTIVANNISNGGNPDLGGVRTTISRGGGNLIGRNDSFYQAVFPAGQPNANGDFVGTIAAPVYPLLAPLGHYGGATKTMPPLVGSQVINHGGAVDSLSTDQRGYPRVLDGITPDGAGSAVPDIGAVEAGEVRLVNSSGDGGTGSLRDRLASAANPGERILFNLEPADSVITLDSSLGVSAMQTVFVDASALVNGAGVIEEKDDGFGNFFVPRGVTLKQSGATRICYIAEAASVAFSGVRLTGGNVLNNTGGGVRNDGTLELINSTIDGNQTSGTRFGDGGGVYNNGALGIHQCTFSQNAALSHGGAIGGSGRLRINQSTISGNTAGVDGGGIWLAGSGTLTITNSLVAENSVGGNGDDIFRDFPAAIVSRGANLIGNHETVEAEFPAGQLVGTPGNPLGAELAPLADNGGPAPTMMLLAGSPAIDAGLIESSTPLTDQRGFERVLGATESSGEGLDVGAYEAAAGEFNLDGLRVYANVANGQAASGVSIEISRDPDFFATVATLAGAVGVGDSVDGFRLDSRLAYPAAVAQDAEGRIFVADTGNHQIRMLAADGEVSTIAGTGEFGFGDGPGTSARFGFPAAVAVGPDGDVYVADTLNHRIRKLKRPATAGLPWTVTTVAGDGFAGTTNGAGVVARFRQPQGLVLDGAGNIYVADSSNHRIRIITPGGQVSDFLGTGEAGYNDGLMWPAEVLEEIGLGALAAEFREPFGLVVDATWNLEARTGNLYIADRGNHVIRRIDLATGEVSTLAGSGSAGFSGGSGTGARFDAPAALAIDAEGNLYVSDEFNHAVRKVTVPGGVVTTVAGLGTPGAEDGNAEVARFFCPAGLLVDNRASGNGALIVADTQNHLLRKLDINPVAVAGDLGVLDRFGKREVSATINPLLLGLDPNVTWHFRWRSAADGSTQMLGQSFYLVDPPTVETVEAGVVSSTAMLLRGNVDPNGSTTHAGFEYSTDAELRGPWRVSQLASAPIVQPGGVAVDPETGAVYVADRESHQVHEFDVAGQWVRSFGSGGAGYVDSVDGAPRFERPRGVALWQGTLYVADEFNHCIRGIDLGSGEVSTYAGSGVAGFRDAGVGAADRARFLFPAGLAVDGSGNLYVADRGNHRVRRISVDGEVTSVAGTGVGGFADGGLGVAQLNGPLAVAVGAAGEVTIADTGNHAVRKITVAGTVITVAGSGSAGGVDGDGGSAEFSSPAGLAVGDDGAVYVADQGNHQIRRIASDGRVTTVAGSGVAGFLNSPLDALHPATAAGFDAPVGIAIDVDGSLVVSEEGNADLRKLVRGELPTVEVVGSLSEAGEVSVETDMPLLPGATYYFRVVAENGRGEASGEIRSFVTPRSDIFVYSGGNTSAPPLSAGQVIDFGQTPYNTPVTRTFTLQNAGDFELVVGGVAVVEPASGGFGLAGFGGGTLAAGSDPVSFTVTLERDDWGSFSDTVRISSDDLDEEEIEFTVVGEVLAPPFFIGVSHGDETAVGVSFAGVVATVGSPAEVAFEYSKYPDFSGTLEVFTTAGSVPDFANGCGGEARFDSPSDVAIDRFGNIYVADTLNHRIRRITVSGECGVLAGSGVAGLADGSSGEAQFDSPQGVAVDGAGVVYVADTGNHRIRRISADGTVSTLAGSGDEGAFTDGVLSAARFHSPGGIATGLTGQLYVADSGNDRVRLIAADGEVSTLAGPDELSGPMDVTADTEGVVYIADSGHDRVVKLVPGDEVEYSGFSNPTGVAVDALGRVFVADNGADRIARIETDGQVVTLAGLSGEAGTNDGEGSEARFDSPNGIAVSPAGTVYVADLGNHRVRQLNLASRTAVAITGLVAEGENLVELDIAGLEPDTTYYYRGVATNGGGTSFSPEIGPYPSFTTSDNNAALAGIAVNGDLVDGFNPCVYSYPAIDLLQVSAQFRATADSPNAAIELYRNGVYCCDLESGVPSGDIPLEVGDNEFHVSVVSADETVVRTYTVRLTRNQGGFEVWQLDRFGSDAGNPEIAAEEANPDLDEYDNLGEYAFDLDPKVFSSDGVPVIGSEPGFVTLTYRRRSNAADIDYRVEWSDGLEDWSDFGVTEEVLPSGGSEATELVLARVPEGGIRMFVRVKVSQNTTDFE